MARSFKLEMHSNTEVWEVRRRQAGRQAPHDRDRLAVVIDWWCLSSFYTDRSDGRGVTFEPIFFWLTRPFNRCNRGVSHNQYGCVPRPGVRARITL